MKVYEWKASSAYGRVCIMINENEGDLVTIIDSGDKMLYISNIGCHPNVTTNQFVFLNSDGSTQTDLPEKLATYDGKKAVEYL